jgi:hypothetical protein
LIFARHHDNRAGSFQPNVGADHVGQTICSWSQVLESQSVESDSPQVRLQVMNWDMADSMVHRYGVLSPG